MNIYTDIDCFIYAEYQLNLQSMGRTDKQGSKKFTVCWGNKESHAIAGVMGASQKLQLLESDKGSFHNQANWIEEYEYDNGLYYNNHGDNFDEESEESDSDFDSEKDSDSDCESNRNSKNNITSGRNIIVSINTLQSLVIISN